MMKISHIEPTEHSKMCITPYQTRAKISELTISSQETRKKFKLSEGMQEEKIDKEYQKLKNYNPENKYN